MLQIISKTHHSPFHLALAALPLLETRGAFAMQGVRFRTSSCRHNQDKGSRCLLSTNQRAAFLPISMQPIVATPGQMEINDNSTINFFTHRFISFVHNKLIDNQLIHYQLNLPVKYKSSPERASHDYKKSARLSPC